MRATTRQQRARKGRRTIVAALLAGVAFLGSVTAASAELTDGLVGVSVTGDASGSVLAVTATGNATSGPGGVAVSGTGQANGGTLNVEGTSGRRTAGAIAFRGRAHLPVFPCGSTCSGGSFQGDWTGSVAGTYDGAAFEAEWTTLSGTAVGAGFSYSEIACLQGVETLAGEANGSGSASAGPGQVLGYWEHALGVPFPIVGVTLNFGFHWERTANTAVIQLNPVSLTLDVAGLGGRTVVLGPQTGTAAFALTSADNATVPTCSTPLTNVRGEIAGTAPLTWIG